MQHGAGIDYDNYHQREVTLTGSRIFAALIFQYKYTLSPRDLHIINNANIMCDMKSQSCTDEVVIKINKESRQKSRVSSATGSLFFGGFGGKI